MSRVRVRYWIVAGVIAAAGATVAGIVLLGGDDGGKIEGGAPTEASADELRSLADSVGHPVYWAGPSPGFKLEVTQTTRGYVYVRYLPEEVPIGDPSPAYTTIATYPRAGAFEAAERAARRKGAVRKTREDGGIVVLRKGRPTSVYLAYPDSEVLIEVYAPDARGARELGLSARVQPVR